MATVVQPFGTVTLVFTDIEGSTRLLSELGQDGYREALADHRRTVRGAFGRHGGYEVDYDGDAFFYAFPSAAGAVRAAAEALEALEPGPIRIRVGVHTGEPGLDPPKYVGLDVHKAARIMAVGHGGQVVVSHATRELLDESLSLKDLGEHRLKDLSGPQRLFQLGQEVFPPLKTLYRTNLPVPTTAFLGRAAEVGAVAMLLRDGTPLLTLTGPGGSGKTRLGLQAVGEVADGFPDGVWWVPLASLSDPALVLAEVARTLDISDQPGRDLGDVLAEVLTGKRLLLLLDNAEHLLPLAARAVARLRDADGPKIVVTSRERLQIAGEHVYRVPPLAGSEGIELFTARARALDAGFSAGAAVEQLCVRLDNLPLAIELAAARSSGLSPEQILERLSERLDLLKAGRDADPRQQTLRSTIEWSHDLLEPQERDLFARLAVFTGGWTLDAAEQVCNADIDTLVSLVDKSLVRRSGERYWMLETIREYARERLEQAAGLETLQRRHATFYSDFATEAEQGMRGMSVGAWFERIEDERPNLRSAVEFSLGGKERAAALRTSSALFRFWESRSGATEGRNWLDRSLATGAGSPIERAKASYHSARLCLFQGDVERAFALLQDAIELARVEGDDGTLAAALGFSGWALEEQGKHEAALEMVEDCLERAALLSEPWLRAEAVLPAAATLIIMGDYDRADPLDREILALKRKLGDELSVADILNNIGFGAMVRGAYDNGRRFLEESLVIARRLNDTFRITLTLGNLGFIAVLEGQYEDALAICEEGLRLCIMRGDRRCGSEALVALAAAHAALGHTDLAARLDAIEQGLSEATGMAPPSHFDLLEPLLRSTRAQANPVLAHVFAEGAEELTLEVALALLER